ncbi:MAG TPA: FimV/HubP family polar landmark protein [Polaromonas sp.]|uniref:FimV/HubP family polar landmark protein n=1 Tax=Polaromonas sp. TaxID=1869339 RepID=UPI002D386BD1|nr:FimV/HubP family polar landmark protein [Polaromonas sp.]HYW56018.1 FimV/HubP family polar landmark protein [Polaromonas sp.]
MNHPSPWRIGAVAAAIALLGSLTSLEAHALALGRVTVQSALGEPLRAEIDIAEINAEEAASLRASVAGADAFKAAGLEYSSAVSGVQISLQRRADGKSFLRLSSDRPISEPFVDLIVEARWASGRIVRDYTMLFDPPNLRQAARPAPAPTAPIVSRPAPPPVAVAPPPPPPVAAQQPYSPPSPPPERPAPAFRAPVPQRVIAEPAGASGGEKVTVRAGDTAGKIAAQNKPASISLDQMLVALQRSNPDAFIGGNINRLKSGAVLEMPSADQAGAISQSEAKQTIVAQSKDFNEFRRQLAEGAPTTRVTGADRQATGQVQAKVDDKATPAATPDKLTLSKGAVQSKAAEEKIALERQNKEAAERVAELRKNIADLNKLTAPTAPSTPTAPATPATPATPPAATSTAPAGAVATAPGVAVTTPGALTGASAVSTTASAPSAALTPASSPAVTAIAAVPPVVAASNPVVPPVVATAPASAPAGITIKPAVVVEAPAEPSLIDELLSNPLLLAAGAAILALLIGFGIYGARRRKNAVAVDSSFLESRLQPDSFFGASGGQRIDTAESNITGSSMVYSPSQLDAAGDVDPVAEADVYLAYGRDLQAEEILKEAIRVSPTRVAIHGKLMEIYAKRRDVKAFEVVAVEAFALTKGEGVEWAHMAEMGRDLDPGNAMYQPGGQPIASAAAAGAAGLAGGAAVGYALQTMAQTAQPAPAPAVDFDLDLDFSLDDDVPAAPAPAPAAAAYVEPTVAMQPVVTAPAADNGMDFSSATLAMPATASPAPVPMPAPAAEPDPSLAASGLNFTLDPVPTVEATDSVITTESSALNTGGGMLEFDLGALSLDLDNQTTESQKITTAAQPLSAFGSLPSSDTSSDLEDPLETKFALAEEFRAIGDVDGARSLAEEVLAESSGALKSKAQAFVNAL